MMSTNLGHILDVGSGLIQVDEHLEADIATAAQCEMVTGEYWVTPRGLVRCPEPQEVCQRPADWIVRSVCTCGATMVELLCNDHQRASRISYQCGACGHYDRFTVRAAERLR